MDRVVLAVTGARATDSGAVEVIVAGAHVVMEPSTARMLRRALVVAIREAERIRRV